MGIEDESGQTRQQQDFDDLNNELAGRGNKIKRFTGNDAIAVHTDRAEQDARADTLMTLAELTEAAQQRRLDAINERLDDLDRRTAEDLRLARAHLEELRDNANRARDGRLVFRSEDDGYYYDENGGLVDPADIDPNTWNESGPSREDWLKARNWQDAARERRDRFESSRDKAHSGDLTDDDLDDLEADLDDLEHDLDAAHGAEPSVTKGSLFQSLKLVA